MKGEELDQLILEGLLIAEDGRLVVHDGVMSARRASIFWLMRTWCNLGLIPVCIKTSSEVLHLVL